MSITEVERRILLNQYKILSAIFPLEAEHYDRMAEILTEGYHENWSDAALGNMKKPLAKADCDLVFDVLVMYDWLQKSYYSLPLSERIAINQKRLQFPGFDLIAEGRLGSYARFLMQRMERFTFLDSAAGLTSTAPMTPIYKMMLTALPKHEERILSIQEIRNILDAALQRPVHAGSQPRNGHKAVAPRFSQASAPSAPGLTSPESVLPHEVFQETPELAAFEAALTATLAREAFSYFRE